MLDHLEPGRVEGVVFLLAADVAHGQDSRVTRSIKRIGLIDVVGRWGGAVRSGEIVVERRMEGRGFVGGCVGGGGGGGGGGSFNNRRSRSGALICLWSRERGVHSVMRRKRRSSHIVWVLCRCLPLLSQSQELIDFELSCFDIQGTKRYDIYRPFAYLYTLYKIRI